MVTSGHQHSTSSTSNWWIGFITAFSGRRMGASRQHWSEVAQLTLRFFSAFFRFCCSRLNRPLHSCDLSECRGPRVVSSNEFALHYSLCPWLDSASWVVVPCPASMIYFCGNPIKKMHYPRHSEQQTDEKEQTSAKDQKDQKDQKSSKDSKYKKVGMSAFFHSRECHWTYHARQIHRFSQNLCWLLSNIAIIAIPVRHFGSTKPPEAAQTEKDQPKHLDHQKSQDDDRSSKVGWSPVGRVQRSDPGFDAFLCRAHAGCEVGNLNFSCYPVLNHMSGTKVLGNFPNFSAAKDLRVDARLAWPGV